MKAADVGKALSHVFDPELGIDVVALGLIYAIDTEPDKVAVTMTMTSRGCPMGGAILEDAENVLRMRFPAAEISVGAVFEPPWDIRMADDWALEQLGFPPAALRASA